MKMRKRSAFLCKALNFLSAKIDSRVVQVVIFSYYWPQCAV